MNFPTYKLTDLGLLGGTTQCHATCVADPPNGNYRASGYCGIRYFNGRTYQEGKFSAFIWDQPVGQPLEPLIGLDNPNSYLNTQALGMNGNPISAVVGWGGSNGVYDCHPMIWWGPDDTTVLDQTKGQARSVNKDNYVVGWRLGANNIRHAFVWTRAGGPQGTFYDLTPGVGTEVWTSEAYKINDSGLVVGYTTWPTGIRQGIAWDLGKNYKNINNPVMYQMMGNYTLVKDTSVAYDINNSGEILAEITNNTPDGYTWSTQTDIYGNRVWPDPGYPGNPSKYGFTYWAPLISYGINDTGLIVGSCGVMAGSTNKRHAFISVAGGDAVSADLNVLLSSPGMELQMAAGISPKGNIGGTALNGGGDSRGFFLNPM